MRPGDVEERDRGDDAGWEPVLQSVFTTPLCSLRDCLHVTGEEPHHHLVTNPAMRLHHALWLPRRPRGVHDGRKVVMVHGDLREGRPCMPRKHILKQVDTDPRRLLAHSTRRTRRARRARRALPRARLGDDGLAVETGEAGHCAVEAVRVAH